MEHQMSKERKFPAASVWFNPLQAMENWFEDVENRWLEPRFLPSSRGLEGPMMRAPRVDVIDRKDEICVRAELPGIEKDDLNISIQDDLLKIDARFCKEKTEEDASYYRRELSTGGFHRTLILPSPVVAHEIKATFENGVMELVAPKLPGHEATQIKIR
jgi:HSP20 family protein